MSCHIIAFVFVRRTRYLEYITSSTRKDITMNWILDTYSEVYATAMMQDMKPSKVVVRIKGDKVSTRIARFFGRT